MIYAIGRWACFAAGAACCWLAVVSAAGNLSYIIGALLALIGYHAFKDAQQHRA